MSKLQVHIIYHNDYLEVIPFSGIGGLNPSPSAKEQYRALRIRVYIFYSLPNVYTFFIV
jgi:hypothetical protein